MNEVEKTTKLILESITPDNNKLADTENSSLDAERKKRDAEKLKLDAEWSKLEAERSKLEAERLKLEAEWSELEAEKSELEAEKSELEAERKERDAESLKSDPKKNAADKEVMGNCKGNTGNFAGSPENIKPHKSGFALGQKILEAVNGPGYSPPEINGILREIRTNRAGILAGRNTLSVYLDKVNRSLAALSDISKGEGNLKTNFSDASSSAEEAQKKEKEINIDELKELLLEERFSLRLKELILNGMKKSEADRVQLERIAKEIIGILQNKAVNTESMRTKFRVKRITILRDMGLLKKMGWVRLTGGSVTSRYIATNEVKNLVVSLINEPVPGE